MGTRGMWGYIIGEERKLTYNHFDSYPDGLGVDILKHVARLADDDALLDDVVAIEMVDEDTPPTPEQIQELRRFFKNPNNIPEDQIDWYWLLRATQGDPDKTHDAGYMIDGQDFANDSLFCEWAYVIDCDNRTLEVYRGFCDAPHEDGRFVEGFKPGDTHRFPPFDESDDRDPDICIYCKATKGTSAAEEICSGRSYWPIRKIAQFPFDNLPNDDIFCSALNKAAGYEDDE